jgi:OOP family OmpA-OmpF porin
MSRRMPPYLALVPVALACLVCLAPAGARAEDKPTPAWKKEKHILEVGWLMGAFFPAKDHALYAEDRPAAQKAFKTGFDIGLRFAYLPVRFVGVEVEADVSPTKIDADKGARTVLFGARGSVILQMPTRLSLFILAGGGMLGVSSKDSGVGKNVDGSVHVGGGLKFYVTKYVALRIDGRDIVSPSWAKEYGGQPAWAHHAEFTFGASFVWGRKGTKMWSKGD